MVLTRQEKEKLILDLYNQGKTYQQIAAIARVSVRDIRPVLEKAEKERENELGITPQQVNEGNINSHQTQRKTNSSQAYRLFSEGKTPLEVAIELNLKEPEATKYYREHWKLKLLHKLDLIYEDIKDDIVHIVKLHRRMKAAGIGVEQVINLIKIANNNLPAVEQEYQRLKKEVNSLESRKFKEYKVLHELQDQIADSKRMLKWLRISCQEEEDNMNQIQEKRIRLKRLVKQFKDNDDEYLKIKKTVKGEVSSVLLDGKGLLRLAFYSLMESMRKNPEKYSSLIYYANNNNGSSIWYSSQYYTSDFGDRNENYPHQLNSYDSFFEALESMLLEDADKLYEQLLKEQVNTIISSYASDKSSSLISTTLASNRRARLGLQDQKSIIMIKR
jgi:DNA-binding CsgD family transcriptional regulator